MPEPFTIIGGVASLATVTHGVTKLVKSLYEIRESYNNVALNITLVTSQLSSIRAALEALQVWRGGDQTETEASKQLDRDLDLSLSCCKILITIIDGKLAESGYTPELGRGQKIRYLWLEDTLKEYVSNLEGQVRALQLLLTIFQCQTATEQKQQLNRRESRVIIEQICAETMSLSVRDADVDDAISFLSQDPSVHLDVDSILMKSTAYRRVYGERSGLLPKRSPTRPSPSIRRKPLPSLPEPPRTTTPPSAFRSVDQTESRESFLHPAPPERLPPPPPVVPDVLEAQKPLNQRVQPSSDRPSSPRHNKEAITNRLHPEKNLMVTSKRTTANAIPQNRLETTASEDDQGDPKIDDESESKNQNHTDDAQQDYINGVPAQEGQSRTPAPSSALLQTPSSEQVVTHQSENQQSSHKAKSQEAAQDSGTYSPDRTFGLPSGSSRSIRDNLSSGDAEKSSECVKTDLDEDGHASQAHSPKKILQAASPNPSSLSIPLGGVTESVAAHVDHAAADVSVPVAVCEQERCSKQPVLQEERGSTSSGGADESDRDPHPNPLPVAERRPSLEMFRNELRRAFGTIKGLGDVDENPGLGLSQQESTEIHSIGKAGGTSSKGQPIVEEIEQIEQNGLVLQPHHVSVAEPIENLPVSETSGQDQAEHKSESVVKPISQSIPENNEFDPERSDSDSDLITDMDGLPILDQEWAALYKKSRLTGGRKRPEPNQDVGPVDQREDSTGEANEAKDEAEDETVALQEPSLSVEAAPVSSQLATEILRPGLSVETHNNEPSPNLSSTEPPRTPSIVLSKPPDGIEIVPRSSETEITTLSLSERDSHSLDASSTISSSEHTESNTFSTFANSVTSTTATSTGAIDGAASSRITAQAELRKLQEELVAAKARGDSHKAQKSLQKSIDVIRRNYLVPAASAQDQVVLPSKESKISKHLSSIRGSSENPAMSDAAATGDLNTVRALLDTKINVDVRDKMRMTPLMLAAIGGHIDVLETLKLHGADEFAKNSEGNTVLHLATACHRIPVIKWLLAAYPPRPAEAVKRRSSTLFKSSESLLAARAPKDLKEYPGCEGSKPLHIAVKKDKGGLLTVLLSAGVQTESKDNRGQTPLHQAILSDRRDSFDALLRHGADVNAVDAKSMSALHFAAKQGHVDMVETLLVNGARRYGFDDSGCHPIHQAAWAGQISCIDSLAVNLTDLETPTKAGESMLHIACLKSNWELATHLLLKNANTNHWAVPQSTLLGSRSKFKLPLKLLTPLQYACCKGDIQMVILLLNHGALVNAATPDGVTTLMMAAEGENTNIVNLLLSRGANVNASLPGTFETALHVASRHHDLDTVQQLCRAGGNFRARTAPTSLGNGNRSPLEEAVASKGSDAQRKRDVLEYLGTVTRNHYKRSYVQPVATPTYESYYNSPNPPPPPYQR